MFNLRQLVPFRCLKHAKGFQMFIRGLARYWLKIKAHGERTRECTLGYLTEVSEPGNTKIESIAKPVSFGLYDQVTKRTRWMPWR